MPFAHNLASVRARIAAACAAAGRDPATVELLAVSKTVPVEGLREALRAGQRAFGENYLQEALGKIAALAGEPVQWHHIGAIQSNKTADIAAHFDWVHGVERLKIAQRLSEQRPPARPPLNLCVQVNVSGEASKAGCQPDQVLTLCRAIAGLPGLRLRGLMTLPAPLAQASDPRAPFRQLRQLLEQARTEGLALDTLSMGMSDDLEPAIAEGANLLRIGTALFGHRAGKPAP